MNSNIPNYPSGHLLDSLSKAARSLEGRLKQLEMERSLLLKGKYAFPIWMGQVQALGPNGESDYTDARHWVKMLYIVGGDINDSIEVLDDTANEEEDEGAGEPNDGANIERSWVTATDILDYSDYTHCLLEEGDYVLVVQLYDAGDPPTPRYVCWGRRKLPQFDANDTFVCGYRVTIGELDDCEGLEWGIERDPDAVTDLVSNVYEAVDGLYETITNICTAEESDSLIASIVECDDDSAFVAAFFGIGVDGL